MRIETEIMQLLYVCCLHPVPVAVKTVRQVQDKPGFHFNTVLTFYHAQKLVLKLTESAT